jgi:hypothetical protein
VVAVTLAGSLLTETMVSMICLDHIEIGRIDVGQRELDNQRIPAP